MASCSAEYIRVNMVSKPKLELSERQAPKSQQLSTRVLAFVVLLGIIIVTVVILQFFFKRSVKESIFCKEIYSNATMVSPCSGSCTITLVESIPWNLSFPSGSVRHPTIYEGWMRLLNIAKKSIDIASFYWSLRAVDTNTSDPSTQQGENVFQGLIAAGKRGKEVSGELILLLHRLVGFKYQYCKNCPADHDIFQWAWDGVKIRVVQSEPDRGFPDRDTAELQRLGMAEVRSLNITRLLGNGILHTKMWLVDGKHFYIGSANLDWRALTQIQELGFMSYNCSCMASDMSKIFKVYWDLATPDSKIPDPWPHKYRTNISADSPAHITVNGSSEATVFLASSPPKFCPPGRTDDLSALLQVINSATKFVYVAVMDYFPTNLYSRPRKFWPVIDDALRRAAFDRQVKVRLMASLWKNTRSDMVLYLRSLAALNHTNVSIKVGLYKVPSYPIEIPYSRVNHNKFMVTESVAYVGTSNWSEDYFTVTGGISYIIHETESSRSIRAQLQAVFERNWDSPFNKLVDCQ